MEDPGAGVGFVPVILFVLIVITECFLTLIKSALDSLSDLSADKLLEHRKKSLSRLVEKKDSVYLATSFTSLLLTLFLAYDGWKIWGYRMETYFVGRGHPAGEAFFFSSLILAILIALLMMVIAGVIPRWLGNRKPCSVLKRFSGPAWALYYITAPAVMLCTFIGKFIMKLFRLDRIRSEKSVTEEEIRSMVDAGGETGAIHNEQRKMIEGVFQFDDSLVSDQMTHRTDITAVVISDTIDEFRNIAVKEGYSRIPVYENDMDNIVGIAYIKDLLTYVNRSSPEGMTVRDFMREPFYVPESMPCDKLFKSMNEKHVQMAVAVDEYGGTAGIITIEDLLESIVGNIQDEYDDESLEFLQITDKVFTMDGSADIDTVEEQLGIEIPEGDYDTIGGFLITLLGFIPEDGTEAEAFYSGYRFTVSNVEDRRIGKVTAEQIEEAEEVVES